MSASCNMISVHPLLNTTLFVSAKGHLWIKLEARVDPTLLASICSALARRWTTIPMRRDHRACGCFCDSILICNEAEEGDSRTCSSIFVSDGKSNKAVWAARGSFHHLRHCV